MGAGTCILLRIRKVRGRMSLDSTFYFCFRLAETKTVVVDRFYIALFCALEQTHCARM